MKHLLRFLSVLIVLSVCLAGVGLADGTETLDAVRSIVRPYYDGAVHVAILSPDLGRNFTDHKTAHAEMVAEKSVEAALALSEAVARGTLPSEAKEEGRIPFSAGVDLLTVAAAGLAHDTGMAGGGFAISSEDGPDGSSILSVQTDGLYNMHQEYAYNFSEIRTYHSLNSCLYVLVNRAAYRAAGFTDVQIDKIAAECAAHSKSSSGVFDLNDTDCWADCFFRIDSIVAAWNRFHPDEEPIRFDRTAFETDDALMSSLMTETLALRVGDVSRDSGPDAEVQSGETVHVDRSTLNDLGGTLMDELENADIVISDTGDQVDSLKSRQVHAGEQNVVFNRCYIGDDGFLVHEITIADGCSAPICTQLTVDDHLGEFYSARDGQFVARIIFEKFEAEDVGFFRDSWEDYRVQAANDYPNINIVYPWDGEVSE